MVCGRVVISFSGQVAVRLISGCRCESSGAEYYSTCIQSGGDITAMHSMECILFGMGALEIDCCIVIHGRVVFAFLMRF